MEHAWLTSRLPERFPEGIDRLYFGAEFCCWRMPALDQILLAIDRCRQQAIALTLVTPILYEAWLPTARQLLSDLTGRLGPADELLFSDFGLISMAQESLPGTTLVCGRALSGQKRGPRILDLDLSAAERSYFRQGSCYSAEATGFLQDQGVARVELDNLLQGIAPLPTALRGSLHVPYALVTTSRNCPFRSPHHDRPCQPTCGKSFSLETEQTRVPLLQGGNSQFLRNEQLPVDLTALRIDRVVQHLELPA